MAEVAEAKYTIKTYLTSNKEIIATIPNIGVCGTNFSSVTKYFSAWRVKFLSIQKITWTQFQTIP